MPRPSRSPDEADPVDEIARRLTGSSREEANGQKAFLDFLRSPTGHAFADGVGVDVSGILDRDDEGRAMIVATLEAALIFGDFGWAVSGHQLRGRDYADAVELWEQTLDRDAIDELLTRAWADPTWLNRSYGGLLPLANHHGATLETLLAVKRLLDQALDHHRKGEYAASTMIVLAQVDGLTREFATTYGFFYGAKDSFFVDDQTLAGMPAFLRRVRKAVNRDTANATNSTLFRRHPIMHGTSRAFGTEVNSTKAFALLASVLDWLRPKALEVTTARQAEHEARYAGSNERDAAGRLLDRRGFMDTRESLRFLASREMSEHRQHGRYRADLAGMFPRDGIGRMKRRDRTTLTVAPDGQSYWAWCQSDTPVCFGIAARDGRVTSSLYVDVGPPGAPEADPRWVDEKDDQASDWRGE